MSDLDKKSDSNGIAGKLSLHTNRGFLDLLFILILLFAFSVSALIIVMIGANVYKDSVDHMQSNFDLRIPLSYISNKVKQSDEIDAVQLRQIEGTDVLVLSKADDGNEYETWIYAYNKQLFEVLLKKGDTIALANGAAILPVTGLDLKLSTNNLLEVTSYDANGKSLSLSLYLRSSK